MGTGISMNGKIQISSLQILILLKKKYRFWFEDILVLHK